MPASARRAAHAVVLPLALVDTALTLAPRSARGEERDPSAGLRAGQATVFLIPLRCSRESLPPRGRTSRCRMRCGRHADAAHLAALMCGAVKRVLTSCPMSA